MAIWTVMLLGFALTCGGLAWWMLPARSRPVPPGRGTELPRAQGPAVAARLSPRLKWGLLGLALVVVPALLTSWWVLRHGRSLDGYDDVVTAQDAGLQALLEGEHLVPPPPLPPDLFLTPELATARPMIASADRRWEQLDPTFVQRVLHVFQLMRDQHGYEMVLLEGWRSPERQALLAAQGPQVTQAGPWQSYHQHGLAVDCAFLREGRVVISERDPWAMRGYQLYGELAEQFGLVWGGRWKMADLGHTEWRKPGVRLGAAAGAQSMP